MPENTRRSPMERFCFSILFAMLSFPQTIKYILFVTCECDTTTSARKYNRKFVSELYTYSFATLEMTMAKLVAEFCSYLKNNEGVFMRSVLGRMVQMSAISHSVVRVPASYANLNHYNLRLLKTKRFSLTFFFRLLCSPCEFKFFVSSLLFAHENGLYKH